MSLFQRVLSVALLAVSSGCGGADGAPAARAVAATPQPAAEARPYALKGTQVWDVPDPATRRRYQLFVSLPESYASEPGRRYPVLYVTDADYAFPVVRSIARRVRDKGRSLEDFILVGLSYAEGDDPATSRNRDYTPTPAGGPGEYVYGGAEAYRRYLVSHALPFVESRFRTDPSRRILMGHSYGGLLGAHILFTEPSMFTDYVLGSPSLWYDEQHMFAVEQRYAKANRDLPANVFMYIGAYEAVRPGDERYHREFDMVADMQMFEARLRSRRYPTLSITSDVIDAENHLTVAPSGFTRALLAVLPANES